MPETKPIEAVNVADDLREMNRFADLMAAQGLAALFLRELIKLRQPSAAELAEWKEFATANGPAGATMVGKPLSHEAMRHAADRATEAISVCFHKAVG